MSHGEISELPLNLNSDQMINELGNQEMFDKLTLAFKSEKLKEDSDSMLKDFISGILRSVQIILPKLEFELISKSGQEMLSYLSVIYEKSFDFIAADVIKTATVLLEAIFTQQQQSSNQLQSSASSHDQQSQSAATIADFAIKCQRPYQNFKEENISIEMNQFVQNVVITTNASSSSNTAATLQRRKSVQGQDYIRWFEPFVNSAMKRYTVTANYKIQIATIAMLQSLVRLRVNYALLDPEGVFLRVLRAQIEFSEKLIWRDADKVCPNIFNFFIQISGDSKSIIKRNEVITLLSQVSLV